MKLLIILVLSIIATGCATPFGEGEANLRKYGVPIHMTAPESMAEGTVNTQ